MKRIISAIISLFFFQFINAQMTTHDPTSFAEMVRQGLMAAENATRTLDALKSQTETLQTMAKIYSAASDIISITDQGKALITNYTNLYTNAINNIESYKRYAENGLLDMRTLNMATAQTYSLVSRAMSQLGGVMKVITDITDQKSSLNGAFSAHDILEMIKEVNRELNTLAYGSDNIAYMIDQRIRDARMAKMKRENDAAMSAVTDSVKANALKEAMDKANASYNKNPDKLAAKGGISGYVKEIDDIPMINEEKAKEAAQYIGNLKSSTVKMVMILFLLLSIASTAYAGIKVMNGENQMMLLKTSIASVIILIMLTIISSFSF